MNVILLVITVDPVFFILNVKFLIVCCQSKYFIFKITNFLK